jgi:hypothetical protein
MHTSETEMRKEITLGNLLSILVPLAVLMLTWGISVQSRLESNDNGIDTNKTEITKNEIKIEKVDDKVDQNFKEIQLKLDRIIENQNAGK